MNGRGRGSGQTALVTGASMGIGVDLAECFAEDNYDLILSARSESALEAVAERLGREHGVKTTVLVADLGERGGGTRLMVTGRSNAIAARLVSVLPRKVVLDSVYALQSPK